MDNTTIISNNTTDLQGNAIDYYKFLIEKHALVGDIGGSSFKNKASFSFIYNFYSKQYENSSVNESENKLPGFYETLGQALATDNKVDIQKVFLDAITNRSTTPGKSFIESSKHFSKYNIYKNSLPMYSDISFTNNIPLQNGFFRLFDSYNLIKSIFESYSNSKKSILTIDLSNITNYSSDPFFIASFMGLLNKHKSLDTFQNIQQSTSNNTHMEILGYILSKHEVQNNTPFAQPIKEWYIPNNLEEVLSVVDCQVKYGQKYEYRLSYIIGFVKTKIYNNQTPSEASFGIMLLDSTRYSDIFLDHPPVPPDFSFITDVGVDNRVKILLQNSFGSFRAAPIQILPEDSQTINRIREAQKLQAEEKMLFRGDDNINSFQIFKLDSKPRTYSDFLNGEIVSLQNGISSYDDSIVANKTFYYTFRSINTHNQFSNPTKVYCLKIINDNGIIYSLNSVFEFEEQNMEMKQANVKLKRALRLSPRINHMIFDETINKDIIDGKSNDILSAVKIGDLYPSIWGKKFKIRLTSISSGRKIDINLDFAVDKKQK